MVQQFASDYVSYSTRPQIDEHGLLRMTGTVSRATLSISNIVNVQIGYDPPPKPLTRAQLSYTYALCNPIDGRLRHETIAARIVLTRAPKDKKQNQSTHLRGPIPNSQRHEASE